eukprot:gene11358-12687_t
MAPLPFLKLAGLLIKTVAKPIASRMKSDARQHPRLCSLYISLGQASHQMMSRLNVMAKGYRVLSIDPLAEEEALARGVDLLSEIFIFSVAGGIMIIEYGRSEAKNAEKALELRRKEEAQEAFLADLAERLQRIESRLGLASHRPPAAAATVKEEKATEVVVDIRNLEKAPIQLNGCWRWQ